MKNPDSIPRLPRLYHQLIQRITKAKIHSKVLFFVLGILSTLWFLIRVIPKPSRAAYPCMQATAPYMSAFVLWITGIGGSAISMVQFRRKLAESKYFLAFVFLMMMGSFYLMTQYSWSEKASAKTADGVIGEFPPNNPIGVAKGIYPGRVVWNRNPEATNESCDNTSNFSGYIDEEDNAWFMAKNNNYEVIDSMLIKSLLLLTGETTEEEAWDQIFRYYNINAGHGNVGYANDQIVFIKINATSMHGEVGLRYYDDLRRNDDTDINWFTSETNPYLVLAMLRQLVQKAGVPELKIYVGDPARNIYEEFYNLWHDEFPDVKYLGNNLIHPELDVSAYGRTPVAVTAEDKVFFADEGTVMADAITDKLFTIFEDMDYLINIPTLKAHNTGGITLAEKNHFGSFTRTWAVHLHDGLMGNPDDPIRLGYGLYRVPTDIMMHNLLSGKSLLSVIDGLYPGEDALGVPFKWSSYPFNGDWCSSIFLSLDPVAISSVGHDFLRCEYHGPTIAECRPCWDGVDDYLHQAADSSWWPEGIVYDPDQDGIIIASLGVHEHWNDSINKAYTRNLGTGNGIELVKAHETSVGINTLATKLQVFVFPNPASDYIQIQNQNNQAVNYQLISMDGKLIVEGEMNAADKKAIDVRNQVSGPYTLRFVAGKSVKTEKIIIQRK